MRRLILLVGLLSISSGCLNWSEVFSKEDQQPAEEAPAEDAAPPGADEEEAGAAAAQNPNPGPPDIPAKIVDKQKALQERPQLVETVNRITASDPVFAPLQGVRAAGSKVEMLGFDHTVQLHKAQYDKFPTFDEFMNYYRDAHVELKGLRPWQVYAYDEQTGTVSLMEDPLEKERITKEWKEQNSF